MRYLFLVLLMSIFICTTALAQSIAENTRTTIIHIGPGTEDAVLDTFAGQKRILVSCNQRRKSKPYFGEILAYNVATGKLDTLPRIGGPTKPAFNPHGIDLVMGSDGKPMLFVVNHYRPDGKHKQNSILIYEVGERSLQFKGQYTDKLLVSPNDVAGLPDGSFYTTMDTKRKKENFGWLMEKLFQVRTSTIVYCSKDHQWSRADNHKLAYANGIHADKNRVIVAATQKGDLALYKRDVTSGKLTFEKDLAHIKGMDNISMLNDHELIVPSHPNSFKFLGHAKDSSKPSPGIVNLVNFQTGTTTQIYGNDGTGISANSVALYYLGKVYIGQVFEDYLLVVDYTDLK